MSAMSRRQESTRTRIAGASRTKSRISRPWAPEQVGPGDRHPGAGQNRMHLALEAGAQPDKLRPVPDEFAQFPGWPTGRPTPRGVARNRLTGTDDVRASRRMRDVRPAEVRACDGRRPPFRLLRLVLKRQLDLGPVDQAPSSPTTTSCLVTSATRR